MEQVHAKNAVRHAEKRRIGTCEFANRVATVSLDAYRSAVPKSHRDAMKQTCVAAIVAHYSNKCNHSESVKNGVGKLRVLGLGVGTKFISHDVLVEEQNNETNCCYGRRIRDCHAEVLARRAFRRQVALEILENLRNKSSCDTKVEAADELSILERVECIDDDKQTSNICYRLKPNVTIHFYASSAPCGNATLKKFVKMEKEVFDTSLVSCNGCLCTYICVFESDYL